MRAELAYRLAHGIQLLHLEGYDYYTNKMLSEITGTSVSTLKRNRDNVNLIDVALRIAGGEDELQ